MKKQLDLLVKTIQQRKSFGSLSLLIEKNRANKKELKEMSQNVMKQQPHQNTTTSILSRQTKLINPLNELQLQVDLLDDDDQLSQSCQRIRDDFSKISSRGNRSHQSTPVSIDINEDNQLRCFLEQQKSSAANPIQPPAIPPRPRRPTLLLQPSTAPQINFERLRPTEMQNLEISQQEHNLAGTDNHVQNPFTQAHGTLVFKSAFDDTQYAFINPNNHTSLPPYSLHTVPITLDNIEANENHLMNLLPPITNLSISSDSIRVK